MIKYTSELVQMVGLNIVTVSPAGTSAYCSRCNRPSVHQHAPDIKSGNRNWLVCQCGRSSDRDHSGAEAIGARSFDASPIKKPNKRKPTPGPASFRKLRVQRDRHRVCQATPFPAYKHTLSSVTVNRKKANTTVSISSFGLHPPRPCGETAPSRVSRGSGVVEIQPERSSNLRPRYLTHNPESFKPLVLDGLCGGYWHRIRMSRPRAYTPPTVDSGYVG